MYRQDPGSWRPDLNFSPSEGAASELFRRLALIEDAMEGLVHVSVELVGLELNEPHLIVHWSEHPRGLHYAQTFFNKKGEKIPPRVYAQRFFMLSRDTFFDELNFNKARLFYDGEFYIKHAPFRSTDLGLAVLWEP